MPRAPKTLGSWVLCAMLLVAAQAQAWTRTSVRGAGAHLDVGADGITRVVLEVDVHVGGGWISQFDIEGLDPALELDPDKPVWMIAHSPTDEQKYLPEATLMKDGKVRISFPHRRVAPWRGDYRLGILYTTRRPVAQAERLDDGGLRIRYALPTWPASLENVRVEVNAPAGARAVDAQTQAHVVEQAQRGMGARTLMNWERVQLPRTVAWQVAFDVPDGAIDASALPEQAPTLRSVVYPERPDPVPLLLSLALLSLCVMRRVLTLLRCRREGLVSLPLVPVGGRMVRGLLLVSTAIAGGVWVETTPLLGVAFWLLTVLLSLDRALARRAPTAVATRPATERDLLAARRHRYLQHLQARAWLDGTTALGGSALLSLWALVIAMDAQAGSAGLPTYILLMATPLWFNGIRLVGPPPIAAALRRLASLRGSLVQDLPAGLHPTGGIAVALSVDEDGRAIGAHLEIVPALPAPGLKTLQLVASEVRWIDSTRTELAWRIAAAEGSPAAHQAAQAIATAPARTGDGALVWLAITHTPAADLPSLLAWLTKRTATARGHDDIAA